ncbi:MAG: SDR family NAD(P)-dependent oxidoreductase [Sporocytophaga sp.]|uniref:SDR family NAD(P)-dependent oxidoreductase n=1 Tax=Sporocytophaga sp. TaxID=2231183 RepID=UPI001B16A6BD|nr:SDR family NAD(P)-dependent oxidoreductase [Sporocytophaga sp.]MBO9699910.1 SDR family NAD(P)-dependent oxidoreductase [Sporocytophaga sp.]
MLNSIKEKELFYTKEQIQQALVTSLAEALYLSPSEIDINKSFIDLGLDSIVGVEWIKFINKTFGLEISSTKIYDYATIKELSLYVSKELENVRVAPVSTLSSLPANSISDLKTLAASANLYSNPSSDSIGQGLVYTNDHIQEVLVKSLADALYLKPSEVDVNKSFIDMGLDSIVGVEWIKFINKSLGLEVSSTKIYDYSTIKELTLFLSKELGNLPVTSVKEISLRQPVIQASASKVTVPLASSFPNLTRKARPKQVVDSTNLVANDKIAIIGMSGRYPQAQNLDQYWENLAQGKNSIIEVPSSRWDIQQYYDADPKQKGKMYCKWMGMLDDVECFDPLFFQISPSEAEAMDPQHRLFLEEGYKAFEDAGYSGATLSNKKCGVYLGIMSNEYSYLIAKNNSSSVNITGNSFAIGAARLSYFLNLKGPAVPIDTACSSSLVGMHVACQALLNGEIDMALAGGVSLYLIPEAYIGMCQAGMLSPEGQCKTFDDSANGFVPGEGVGAVVLKRLEDAQRDNDHIYGVILGSGINQDGKTNGITAPSVNSQTELEREIYSKYKINPETISYVETHGTGTKLGDPIELEALSTVFKEKTLKKNFCALGSVKSNVGHTSGAAGVASVQKVLLSLKHKTLVPTLNVVKENTIFDFKNSPFYISREKQDWKVNNVSPVRRASVSSFGFSGTNSHLVIEEYLQKPKKNGTLPGITNNGGIIIPLSARIPAQLKQRGQDLSDFILKNKESIDLIDMAYTLQVGRDEMRERLGFVVNSIDELSEKLKAYISGVQSIENCYQGQVTRDKDHLTIYGTDADLQKIVDKWISDKNLSKLVDLWVKGLELDWSKLYGNNKPQRVSLPTYPFAKEKYWVEVSVNPSPVSQEKVNEMKPKNKAAQEVEEKIQKMYFYPDWKKSPISLQSETNKSFAEGPTLVIDTTDELYNAAIEKLKGSIADKSFILVKLGGDYQELASNVFTINQDKEGQFNQLVDTLKERNQLPRQIIYHGLTTEHLEKDSQVNDSFYTLFYLCKALLHQKNQQSVKILSIFSTNGSITVPQSAAIGAFFKTLNLENPKYLAKVIEVQSNSANPEISIESKINIILDEFREELWNKNEVRYKHDNGKYIRNIRELSSYIPVSNKLTTLPFKQGGVYIISGALGGLGYIISEYLAKNYQCKLILFGRSALKAEQEAKVNQLKAYKAEVIYLQADASKLEDMEAVVHKAKLQFSQINGVIHSAGVNKDSFILKKTKEEIEKVLAPKIYGTLNLDQATKDENLDVFILFSSIAGVMGNLGQCEYAYGNHFLDSFAELRESKKKQQKRFGKTLSINWPFWEEGGMVLSLDELAIAKKVTGVCPIPINVGIQYLEEFLQSHLTQGIAFYGYPSRVNVYSGQESKKADTKVLTSTIDPAILLEKTEAYLKALVGAEIKLSPEKIDSQERFETFGIDSIIVSRFNVTLEKDLGALSKTLFYEYSTIEELAGYLTREAGKALVQFFNLEYSEEEIQTIEDSEVHLEEEKGIEIKHEYGDNEQIAIIGIHGYYPQSEDLNKYWENLKQGKDLIDLVPASRWDYEQFYHQDPERAAEGKIYCKWGGFVNDVDKFDPQFFNISSEEAKIMDPQERLFLQSVWGAIEDAGYSKNSLKKRHPKAKSADVGVFVGVTTNSYSLLAAEEWSRGNVVPSAQPWSIANRVSYIFDFQGPSMPIDTACSSSLVAIHLACESLKKQECQVAVAGGVNLYLHPSKYHSFCKRRMVSLEGKCRSYGAGDDGFVPGEGVGSVILKPLRKAIADKDHIYAVVAGSAFDHGGRSNGYSAPNPNSQASLIEHTLRKSQIHPETIGYIEGHGTGTQLGDSLEIVALTNAFNKQTKKKQFCPIGSVKANIGHPESAAGIAGVAKVLLQMKHKQIVPTIHSEEVNPNIDFKESPFYLEHKLTTWESSPDYPRRAIINSFGAGGVNACMILEEYEKADVKENVNEPGSYLVILSAKNEDRLRESVNRLLTFVGKEKNVNLSDLSYSLQVGREGMQERLAIIVSGRTELMEHLKGWRQQIPSDNIYQGKYDPREGRKKSPNSEDIQKMFRSKDLCKLAELWVAGTDVDWENLYETNKPNRIALPTYPFAKERYWVSDVNAQEKKKVSDQGNAHANMHPLVSYNSSTLREVSFSSLLSDKEFYAMDHQVHKEKIFPGSGFLEMAGISGNIAGEQKVSKITDIVWANPLSFKTGPQLVQTILKPNGRGIEYQIVSLNDDNERVLHSEGRLFFKNGIGHSETAEKSFSINVLKEKCAKPQSGSNLYNLFTNAGFNYGLGFQTIQEFYISESFALSKLKIADYLKSDFDQFILHPSLLDGALQTVAGLLGGSEPTTPYLPFAIDELEIIRPMSHVCYAYVENADNEKQAKAEVKKFNIQLLNEGGDLLVKLTNFYVRALGKL